jgi:predicted RNA-binding protein with TRAM domain
VSYTKNYGKEQRYRDTLAHTSVEVGKEYELEVTQISEQGDGMARVKGFIVFVRKGKVGQKPKVKINRVGNTFAVAKIVN